MFILKNIITQDFEQYYVTTMQDSSEFMPDWSVNTLEMVDERNGRVFCNNKTNADATNGNRDAQKDTPKKEFQGRIFDLVFR